MKRKFLYEILDDILTAEELKTTLFLYLDQERGFKDLVDIIYNQDYSYEFDKSINDVKARSTRENGGFPTAWLDVLKVLKNKLITSTNLSSRVPDYYIKAVKSCNYKDVDILNYALQHRNFPGFKGARKKMFTDLLKEYYGEPNGETN